MAGTHAHPIWAGEGRLSIFHADILLQTTTATPSPTPATTSTPGDERSPSNALLVCGAILLVLIIIGGVGWSTRWKKN
jgi:hypothetical protein